MKIRRKDEEYIQQILEDKWYTSADLYEDDDNVDEMFLTKPYEEEIIVKNNNQRKLRKIDKNPSYIEGWNDALTWCVKNLEIPEERINKTRLK